MFIAKSSSIKVTINGIGNKSVNEYNKKYYEKKLQEQKNTDYLVVLNKENLIDESYYENVELVNCVDVFNKLTKLEKETYKAFLALRSFLKTKNINIELDSCYRSIEKQQQIMDEFTIKYGEAYAKEKVAPVKSSEHHTGLAIDLAVLEPDLTYLNSDDLYIHEPIFREIHQYLSQFGFILRYPKDKETITGYKYEPWHIRYVGLEPAKYMYENDLTLEEYVLMNKKTK